jgi:hypothetical protein
VKGCAEEEDGLVAQGSSSFMLRVKTVWVLMSICSKCHQQVAWAEGFLVVVVDSGRSVTTTSWMVAAMLPRRVVFQMLLTLAWNL